MARTLAALFADRGQAERALRALIEAGLAQHPSTVLTCSEFVSTSAYEMAPGRRPSPAEVAFRSALDALGLPRADRAEFADAIARGGCLLSARVDSSMLERAIAVIEAFEPVDLDRRAGERPSTSEEAPLGAGLTAGQAAGLSNTAAVPGMAGMARSTHDVGASDLGTKELSRGDRGTSAAATGALEAEDRAGAPGALELAHRPDAALATKQSPGAEQTAPVGTGPAPDLYRRDTTRPGRVRAYVKV